MRKSKNLRSKIFFMKLYFTTREHIFQLLMLVVIVTVGSVLISALKEKSNELNVVPEHSYWLLLHRKSNKEYLYIGVPGEEKNSKLVKTFQVKTGVPRQKPTPLPQLLGRKYWLITDKFEVKDDPEIAPFFLKLDIPYSEEYPFGPTPYLECNGPSGGRGEPASQRGEQCDWILPGSFGLHGINGDSSKIADSNPGSSGCVRHKDEDITFLYKLLEPEKGEVRYYIEDV